MKSLVLVLCSLFVFIVSCTGGGGDGITGGDTSSSSSSGSGEQDYVFDATTIPSIYVTMDANALATLHTEIGRYTEEYTNAAVFQFVKNGVTNTLQAVGIRPRGNTSRGKGKMPYKFSFSTYQSGRRFYKLKKMNLNPDVNDPGVSRRYLFHYVLKDMGVPTQSIGYARLYINGKYHGIYMNMEQIDKAFVSKYWGDNEDGNLYKCVWPSPLTETTESALKAAENDPYPHDGSRPKRRAYGLKINETADDYSGLAALTTLINGSPTKAQLEAMINIDNLLKNFAAEVMFGHWDNYWKNQQNYYLYEKTVDGKWEFFSYDSDNTFGSGVSWGFDTTNWDLFSWASTSGRPLVASVMAIPEFVTKYSNYLCQIATNYLDPASPKYLGNEMDRIKALIQTAVDDDCNNSDRYGDNYYGAGSGTPQPDMFGWTMIDFNNSYGTSYNNQHIGFGLKQFLATMYSRAQSQLDLGGGGGYAKYHNQIYVRGSFNNWGGTAMTLVGDYQWQVTINTTNGAEFKFDDQNSDWDGINWGDDDPSGTSGDLEESGENITNTYPNGNITINFNGDSTNYSFTQ